MGSDYCLDRANRPKEGRLHMRRTVLIAALLLVSASAQAGQSRHLSLSSAGSDNRPISMPLPPTEVSTSKIAEVPPAPAAQPAPVAVAPAPVAAPTLVAPAAPAPVFAAPETGAPPVATAPAPPPLPAAAAPAPAAPAVAAPATTDAPRY